MPNKFFGLTALLFILFSSQAQRTYNVAGRITKETDNSPLTAAEIRNARGIKVRSDSAGRFTIELKSPDTLHVSHEGYHPITVPVSRNTDIIGDIRLKAVALLDEVQVSTGYQQLPKERATGSFELIDNKRLSQQVTTDILSRLEGTSSILFDKNSQRPSMTIRGFSSLTSSIMAPLVIVDNFPYEGDINNINPNDVESVTLLKDAAASSIWGARAGNGVIVITTRKAKTGKPLTIDFNSNITWVTKPDLYNIKQMSSSDFVDVEQYLFRQGFYGSKESSSLKPAVSPVVETLIALRDGKMGAAGAAAEIARYKAYDLREQYSDLMYQKGTKQQYALNLQGSSNNLLYYLSGGLDKNTDNLSPTYRRVTFNSNALFKPLKIWELTGRIFYAGTNTKTGKTSYSGISNLSTSYPYLQIADASGNALPFVRDYRQSYLDTAGAGYLLDWNYYPLTDYLHDYTQNNARDILLNLGSKLKLLPFLSLDLNYQYENQSTDSRRTQDVNSYYSRDMVNRYAQLNRTTGSVTYIVPKGDILYLENDRVVSHNGRAQLSVNKSWARDNLTAIAGGEIRQVRTWASGYDVYGYDDNTLSSSNMDFLDSYPNFITGSKAYVPSGIQFTDKTNRYVSVFANASYLFQGKYTISASARRDASNLFGVETNNKWTPLWSVGGSWNIARGKWDVPKWLNALKLRTTYGTSGNVNPGIAAVTTLKNSPSANAYTNYKQAYVSSYGNPDLQWENVHTFNIGFDYAVLNNRINGSFDFYNKEGKNLLGTSPLDYTAGIVSVTKNVASMTGHGIDLNLNARILDRTFKWSNSFIFSWYNSKVTDYYLSSENGSGFVNGQVNVTGIKGKPVYSLLSYAWAGLDDKGNPQGILNGKPSIDYTFLTGSATKYTDLVYNGSVTPAFWGSMNNTFSWKELTLSINILYKMGYYFRKPTLSYYSLFYSYSYSENGDYANRWRQAGDEKTTNVPSLVYPANANRDNLYKYASVTALKGDIVRLQYVMLEYHLTGSNMKSSWMHRATVYLAGNNLGTIWRKNNEGLDPEYPNALAPTKTFSLGIKMNLNN